MNDSIQTIVSPCRALIGLPPLPKRELPFAMPAPRAKANRTYYADPVTGRVRKTRLLETDVTLRAPTLADAEKIMASRIKK